jgi:hypothetical protein
MALYSFEEDEPIPVAPWSVHVPTYIVEQVATPIAEFWVPNVETA